MTARSGANVTITNTVPNTTLSNLYVQFTAFSGPAGSEVCNSLAEADVPADITDLGLGLWSSPVMVAGEVTPDWTFSFVTTGRFTFAGRVLASVAQLFPNATYPAGSYGIVANGTGVVYSAYNTPQLAFLEPGAGASWNQFLSMTLPDYAWALARDGGHGGKIWYATDSIIDPTRSSVGYVRIDDHGATGASIALQGIGTITPKPWSIKVDPDGTLPLSRAWFVASDFDYTSQAYVGARLGYVEDLGVLPREISPVTWVDSTLDGTLARSMVFAENDNIYVTLAPNGTHPFGAIQRCTRAGCGVTPDTIALLAECESPDDIIYEPVTGKLWFTVGVNTAAGGVCTLDPFALDGVTRVAEAPYPGYLALGPAGEVWVGEYASGDGTTDRVQRIVEGELPFYVSTDFAPVFGSVWNADRLWVVTLDGVNRITP